MKRFKKIFLWTLIPVCLELAGFTYFNSFYLNDETSFNTQKVVIAAKKANKINVPLPDTAQNIDASYSGNYVSYCDNGTISVINTSSNSQKQISLDDGTSISKYVWLPDRDIMLIAEKYSDSYGESCIKFESYNAAKDEKTVLTKNNTPLSITLDISDYDVQNIALSTTTNVTYVQVGSSGGLSRVYRIDVMQQLQKVSLLSSGLGNIATTNKADKLVYEDDTYDRIRIAGVKDPIATGESAIHYLLGTDSQDRIYIGNGQNGKVSKIFVADTSKSSSQWNIITLKKAADKSDIHVMRDGKIYVNDSAGRKVTELLSGKETSYKGTLVKVYDLGIISQNSGTLTGVLF